VESGNDLWEFAVEIGDLRAAGMNSSDFRWLVTKGYVQHGRETSLYGDPHRSFRPGMGLTFLRTTSFVLTPAGAALLRQSRTAAAAPPPHSHFVPPTSSGASAMLHLRSAGLDGPHSGEANRPQILRHTELSAAIMGRGPSDVKPLWEARNRELRVDGIIVKRFRVPAGNQELILSAFQEEGWPAYIDDPLPTKSEVSSKRRLHNAITRLNGGQLAPLLRFHGNGNGEGVGWQFLDSLLAPDSNAAVYSASWTESPSTSAESHSDRRQIETRLTPDRRVPEGRPPVILKRRTRLIRRMRSDGSCGAIEPG